MINTGFQLGVSDAKAPDPMTHFELYRGVAWKRAIAYLFDVVVIGFIMFFAYFIFGIVGIMTFGLFNPLFVVIFALIPFCYHMLLLSGPRHATLGMRLFGLEMRSLTNGYPDQVQAAVQTFLFYLTVYPTGSLVLIWAIFDPRRRTLHDVIAGTYVVNRQAALAIAA
jgi:uncharacterized RDD family membrane protein YckC